MHCGTVSATNAGLRIQNDIVPPETSNLPDQPTLIVIGIISSQLLGCSLGAVRVYVTSCWSLSAIFCAGGRFGVLSFSCTAVSPKSVKKNKKNPETTWRQYEKRKL
ncbi:hypothetical protein BaRGS_00022365 [Batillaria attramentaria]|uniref:Uncharacterized protein n=1 Tax=Batillaria attramentaria TaxID=370345 RepID=A0ABD0KHP3_9CAEN